MVILLLIDGNSILNQAAITSVTMEDDGLQNCFFNGMFVESLFNMEKKTPSIWTSVTTLQRYQREDEWNDHLWVPADRKRNPEPRQRKPPSKNQKNGGPWHGGFQK